MSLTRRKVDLLREFVGFVCQDCHKHEKKVGRLEPHKITPRLGYVLWNIKMVCSKCHKIFNSAQRIADGTQRG